MEEILAEALGPRPTPAAPDSAAVDLPQVPERPAVLAALGAMTSAVRRCAGGATGDAVVRYAFSGRGTVTAAQVVGGSFAGASAAECMAAAARGARVPPFRREALTVEFPYVIR